MINKRATPFGGGEINPKDYCAARTFSGRLDEQPTHQSYRIRIGFACLVIGMCVGAMIVMVAR